MVRPRMFGDDMHTLKKCRFKVAWQTYRVGDVIEPTGTLRDWLVARGYVDVLDTGTVKAPLTRGTLTLPKRRRA